MARNLSASSFPKQNKCSLDTISELSISKNTDIKTADLSNIYEQSQTNLSSAIRNYTNGLYSKTILIRNVDDTFLAFNCDVHLVDEFDLGYCLKIIDAAIISKVNVLIDSRLTCLLAYITLKYSDKIFIYNVFNAKIINIYRFYSELFNISINELSLGRIKLLVCIKLFISHFIKQLNIQCNAVNIAKFINNLSNNNKSKNFICIITNCIGIKHQNEVNKENINTLVELFTKYFSIEILNKYENNIIREWDLQKINIYEIMVMLSLLINKNYSLSLIESI